MHSKAIISGICLILLAGCVPEEVDPGRATYAEFCAVCHGQGGKGDGPAAIGLEKPPADLTMLAARNGGEFPMVRVMSVIDGYTRRDQHGSTMPEFGALLHGPTTLVDTEDGVLTPTPERLVAVAEYLRTLQQ